MPDEPSYAEAGDDAGTKPAGEWTGMPRWVKVFGIVALAVLLLLLIVLLTGGGGGHGPGRHASSPDPRGHALPSHATGQEGRAA